MSASTISAHSRASGNPAGEHQRSGESAGSPLSRGRAVEGSAARYLSLIGLTLALGCLAALGSAYLQGHFLADAQGQPIANDFVNVWAAGRLTLDGDPAAAYDWPVHKAAEVRAVGHDVAN